MDSSLDADFQHMAAEQLGLVRRYSATASSALEKIYPFGAQAVFRAALTVVIFKSMIDLSGAIPEQFNYRCLLKDYPAALPLLDQSIACLLQDGNYRRRTVRKELQ